MVPVLTIVAGLGRGDFRSSRLKNTIKFCFLTLISWLYQLWVGFCGAHLVGCGWGVSVVLSGIFILGTDPTSIFSAPTPPQSLRYQFLALLTTQSFRHQTHLNLFDTNPPQSFRYQFSTLLTTKSFLHHSKSQSIILLGTSPTKLFFQVLPPQSSKPTTTIWSVSEKGLWWIVFVLISVFHLYFYLYL